jgi:hypothetical protein
LRPDVVNVATASALFTLGRVNGRSLMDKVKPLTGVLSFVILSLCSNYSYAQTTDGSRFVYKNNTSQNYIIQSDGRGIWFGDQTFTITIPRHDTRTLGLEGRCVITDPAAVMHWIVYNENDPNKKYDFRLEVSSPCAKRLFMVNGQYRKIEVDVAKDGFPRGPTPTPYFRFTIEDLPNSVIFVQEGPQKDPFN